MIDCFEDLDGINILSVARRGWRKDTKDTSVAAISDQSRKMPNWIHVTKRPRFRRHEKYGTYIIYLNFASKDVTINIHSHDRNLSTVKLIKYKEETMDKNDL